MRWLRGLLEYARAGLWVPADETRERVVYHIPLPQRQARGELGTRPLPRRAIVVRERERLHFGRWGRWKWRAERRWVTVEPRRTREDN